MLSENERDELINFIINADKLPLNERDYKILRDLLKLIRALNLKASLLKAKEAEKMAEKAKIIADWSTF
jgi:hypothetical protein